MPIQLILEGNAADNAAGYNFIDTGAVNFALPAGVTFTSASGDFLTGATVPEPATWALMLVGIGLLGAAARWRPFGPARPA